MKSAMRLSAALAVTLVSASFSCHAQADAAAAFAGGALPLHALDKAGGEKSVSTASLGARGTVTTSATMFGGFALSAAADVYILVRGNSLGTLGVTQNFLDAPRTRLYDVAGTDLVTDVSGRAGFNGCIGGSALTDPVVNYYTQVRGAPAAARDSCVAVHLPAGVYTFSVTPSIPGVTTGSTSSVPTFGEVLFEVSFNP